MALTSQQIEKAISNHSKDRKDYKRYERYYQGNNQYIQDKQAKDEPDKRIILAFALKIVKTIIGYMFKPSLISYSALTEEAQEFFDKLKDMFIFNDEDMTNTEVAESMLSKGKAYKQMYIQTEKINGKETPGVINYVMSEPDNIIVNWTNELKPEMESVYYYYDSVEIDDAGNTIKTHHFYEYTKLEINYYIAVDDNNYKPVDLKPNPIQEIPFVEFISGKERRSIFAHVITLIDEADELFSTNFANEHASIGNAILMMSRFLDDQEKDESGLTERDKFLTAKFKTLEGMSKDQGDFAEWLVKEVQWEGVFGAFDRARNLIYDFAMIPDFTDPNFMSAESGYAMELRLTSFENLASLIESYFKKSLRKQLKLLTKALVATGEKDYSEFINDIEITFERNLPKNKKEAAELVQLVGMNATRKSKVELLHNADIIKDVDQEIDDLKLEIADITVE